MGYVCYMVKYKQADRNLVGGFAFPPGVWNALALSNESEERILICKQDNIYHLFWKLMNK